MSTQRADLSSLRIDKTKRDNPREKGAAGKIFLVVILLLLLALAVFLIGGKNGSFLSGSVAVQLTSAVLQSPAQSRSVLTASGYVVAQRKAAVASKGTGLLVYLGVEEGDPVTANQVIARLEDNDIRAQLDEATANLDLQKAESNVAEKNFLRQQAMVDAGASAEADLDAAEARYHSVQAAIDLAKARVNAAEIALENTLIRAPFAGTVLTKNADVGEIVAPLAAGVDSRAAVVTIADMKSLQVEADVSESNIEKVIAGQDCQITLDAYPSHSYAGTVAKIVPTADRAKATVMVKVAFVNYDARVLPEMSARVLFLKAGKENEQQPQAPVLMIPGTALVTRNGRQLVFRVVDQQAREAPVVAGKFYGTDVEIISGLTAGEPVIANPTDQITDGTKVTVQ